MRKLLLVSLLTCVAQLSAADVAYSPPVGGMNFLVNAGTVVAPVTTTFTIPLLDNPAASGATVGRIASVTASTITVTNAGWTDGALAMTQFPYVVRIVSGAAEGATLSVTANTANTLTVAGRDLTLLGITVGSEGDRFRLIPVDTLNTLFGANTLLGAANPTDADIVTLSSSVQLSYYYNTSLNRWVRTTGPTTDRGTTQIPIDSVVSITRKSSALNLQFVGRVPETKVNLLVANSGATYTHTGYPKDVSIGDFALQNRVGGWVSNASAAQADVMAVNSGGTWLLYFHNGTFWQRTTGPATNRDSIVISAGSAIQMFKRGVASGTTIFSRERPFSL